MVNILKNKFSGTLQAILYKINLTRFLGSNQTYLSIKWLNIFKFPFSQIFPMQMCVQRKKPEVSSMFLRGDMHVLVHAL
jgi:hypothetical protein